MGEGEGPRGYGVEVAREEGGRGGEGGGLEAVGCGGYFGG